MSTRAAEKVQNSRVSKAGDQERSGGVTTAPSAAANRATRGASPTPSAATETNRADGYSPTRDDSASAGTPKKTTEGGSDDQNAKVKVDGWKKGRNDCLERVLQNQGYSLKEIYTKGADGKTLLQSIAAKNGLTDPNKLADGRELNIPRKANTVSAEGLKDGQKITREAEDASGSLAVTAQKNPDGSKSVGTDANTVAPVSSGLTVQAGGAVHGTVARTEKGLESNVHGENARGDAKTDIKTVAGPQGTATRITDSDQKKNLSGLVDQNGLFAVNNGTGGGVEAGLSHGPKSKLESVGSWLDQTINPWGPSVDSPKEFSDASQVDHLKRPDGSISVSATGPEGKKTEWNRGADGFFQRNLRALNNFLFGG